MLDKFHFPKRFRKWIMTCVTSRSLSPSVSMVDCVVFSKAEKGLGRETLFPLLFVLIMEYFTRILKKMSTRDDFCFYYGCKALKLNHLIFGDDLMLFCKGDVKSVHLMMGALKAFSNASGFSANNDKSTIYFGNVQEEVLLRMLQVT